MQKNIKINKFWFDIDNTITITPSTDYSVAKPIKERIEAVNKLYDEGHEITYWTARGTVSGSDLRVLTEEQLEHWGAKYHYLQMGKPAFDYFIDDKVVNAEEWFRPLRVGLVLNNLVRDYLSRLIEVYSKYSTPKDAETPVLPIEPINPYKLEDSFPMEDDDEFDDVYSWLYHSVSLEVFGGANQTKTNLLARINAFQDKIHDKFILLSKETTRSKYATLSFLSKSQFDLNELIFVEDYEEYWKHVDVLITDNPEILKVKPDNKTAVVLKNDYNNEYHAIGYGINSPDDIFRLPIFNRKPITKEEMLYISNEIPEGEEEDKLVETKQTIVDGARTVEVSDVENVEDLDLTELRDKVSDDDDVVTSD